MSHLNAPSAVQRRIPRILALVGVLTLAVWGARVGLLEEGGWSLVRVVVSIAFGIALLTLAGVPKFLTRRVTPGVLLGYGIWMVIVWVPSLVRVLGSTESLGFQAVHTALAAASLFSGAVIAGIGRRAAGYPTSTSTQTAANSAAK